MWHTDIAIVGSGMAGSTAAAMLSRAGIDMALIDPHEVYPFDFRREKRTSCPVAGTGLNEAHTDGERLCNVHISHWLATPGMTSDTAVGTGRR